jgi:hypothetical protein
VIPFSQPERSRVGGPAAAMPGRVVGDGAEHQLDLQPGEVRPTQ